MWRLAWNDLKLIFREPALRVFFLVPFLLFFVVNYLLPYLTATYEAVGDYVPLILTGALAQTSVMFSFIYSMVLIDEKDTAVAKVYGVLPVAQFQFILVRLLLPMIWSMGFTLFILMTQPFYDLPFFPSLFICVIMGLLVPIVALGVAVVAKNKMEGMTWLKLFNLPIALPLLVFFVPSSYAVFFGCIPTHWPYRALNNLIQGEAWYWNVIIGLVYHLLLVYWLVRFFVKTHFR